MPASSYSFLRGLVSPDALASWAVKAGYRGFAIADSGNIYALPATIAAAEAQGLRALAAARIPWEGRILFSAIALDKRGYGKLCELLSRRFAVRTASLAWRQEARECEGGDPLSWVLESGGEGLALLSRHPDVLRALKAGGCPEVHGELAAGLPVRSLAGFCREEGIPVVAVNAAIARDALDLYRYRLLRASATRLTLSAYEAFLAEAGGGPWFPAGRGEAAWIEDLSELPPDPSWSFRSAEEMRSLFSALPESLEAAERIMARAEPASSFISKTPIFPPYEPPLPEGGFGPAIGEAEAFSLLKRLCEAGAPLRYGETGAAREDVASRLARELGVISSKGFATYFLVVRDIVRSCPRTCGRGSAASSIVSYLLGLTHVDPLEHDLFFDRFLNEGRSDPPDIDIDFPWDERPELLARVFKRYAGRSGIVADHCSFRRRGALREAALAFGASDAEMEEWAGYHVLGKWEEIPFRVRRSAELIKGMPRYLGTHPGGVVIVPGRITDYTQVQPSRLGYPVIAWEKDGAEAAGLVKIDLLGNRSLAVLRDCIELCRPQLPGDGRIEWGDFSVVRDERARSLIERGDTTGVFYVESPATRSLLRKMGTGDYPHLVAASSIIRPAANKWIDEYVVRMKTGTWERLPAPAEEALRETYGVMVYQEDVSRVAMAVAGFDSAKADRLRKALTKKDRMVRVKQLEGEFREGALARGSPPEAVERMWDMIMSFDGYSFCKAHSASYALVSYKLAYLKARRPVEFLCCVINNGGGFYHRQVYVNEARRLGARILPPHVNESEEGYAVRPCAEARSKRALRCGLSQVKGLSSGLVERIVRGRGEGGAYRAAGDFFRRTRPASDEARALVISGALDGLPPEAGFPPPEGRSAYLWLYESCRAEVAGGGFLAAEPSFLPSLGPGGDYPAPEKLVHERESLGLFASLHPAELFGDRARRVAARLGLPKPVDSRMLSELVGAEVAIAGTCAAGKEVLTRGGKAMCFRSFEDSYGIFEAVLFPEVYGRVLPVLEGSGAFLVVGTVQDDLGSISLEVRDLLGLSRGS